MKLPAVPAPFTLAPDDSSMISRRIDDFFTEVLDALEYSTRARGVFVEITSAELYSGALPQGHPTNDRLTLLVLRDTVVASVLERRDDLNFVQVLFALYLTPEAIARVQPTATESLRFPDE